MNAPDQPGQLLFCGFEGTQVPDDLAALIAAGRIGGVVLFARNIESPEQVRALTTKLHQLAPEEAPLMLAIDQEGGRVQRLRKPWTEEDDKPRVKQWRLDKCDDTWHYGAVVKALKDADTPR